MEEQSRYKTRLRLGDIGKVDTMNHLLTNISVFIEADTQQPVDLGKIQFGVDIINDNPVSIELRNPYDFINYTITDAEGWPVGLDPAPSRVLIHTTDQSLSRQLEYLDIMSISSGGQEKNVAEEVRRESVEVTPETTYSYIFEIKKILAINRDKARDGQAQTILPSVPEGKYNIVLTLALVMAREYGETPHRLLQSGKLAIQLK